MSKLIDITGKRYNHLIVVERAENAKGGIARWKCKCDCGNFTIVRGSNLKSGAVKSCGCLIKNPHNKTHNQSKTPLYRKWQGMKRRCYDPKDSHFPDYGGRGIKVCDEWINSFEAFRDWTYKTRNEDGLTLERIDNTDSYSPENCKWVGRKEQANNRRSCLIFEHSGKKQNLMQWCEELKLDYKLVHNRIYKSKWSFEKAISLPKLN